MNNVVAMRQSLQVKDQWDKRLAVPEKLDELTDDKRQRALQRQVLVCVITRLVDQGASMMLACQRLASELDAGNATPQLLRAARAASVRGKMPSEATLRRWCQAYARGGIAALGDRNNGQPIRLKPWHEMLIVLLQTPPRKSYATYARLLNERGLTDTKAGHDTPITPGKVARIIKRFPPEMFTHSKALHGERHHRQNFTPYRRIRKGSIEPGQVWEVDGHRLDWFTAHHNTGNKYRYEVIAYKDKGSGYICGWWLIQDENSFDSLYAMRHAMRRTDHVPMELHVDCGPGYKNELIAGAVTGFVTPLGIHVTFGIPYNARGHGAIETEWRILEDQTGKCMGRAYCGQDQSQEFMRRIDKDIATGAVVLPTFEQTLAAISEHFERINHALRKGRGSRAEEFAQRDPCSPGKDMPLPLPREQRRCSDKAEISWRGRVYRHKQLMDVRGRDVLLEYDIHDVRSVRVLDMDGRWLCDAAEYEGVDWKPASLVEEMRTKRLAAQKKRRRRHDLEDEARARQAIDVSPAQMLDVMDDNAPSSPPERRCQSPDQHHMLFDASTAVTAPAPRKLKTINPAALDHLKAEIAADERAIDADTETPNERLARALDLDARQRANEALSATDARWLEIYRTSSEYHSQLALREDLSDEPEENL